MNLSVMSGSSANSDLTNECNLTSISKEREI